MSNFTLGSRELADGEFVRQDSAFRDHITADGSSGFPAASGRYHLYVALACPWSHRAVIARRLKGLEDVIGISYLHPYRDERGWRFAGGRYTDDVNGYEYLGEAYEVSRPGYDARVTVPVLWDREQGRIVSNESGELLRMLDQAWDEWARPGVDLYPADLRAEIDELNAWTYDGLNNGVYRTGFADSQEAYERHFHTVQDTLLRLEALLADRRYLAGDRLTEADWRVFPSLVRFDWVYHTHFRLNGLRVADLPNLFGYARELYQWPGIAETVAWDEITEHYYTTHDSLNPKRIVPVGPRQDWAAPHGREVLPASAAAA